MRITVLSLTAAISCSAVLACGGTSDAPVSPRTATEGPAKEGDIREVVQDFHRLFTSGDGAQVCEFLTPDGQKELLRQFELKDDDCVAALTFDAQKGEPPRTVQVDPIGAQGDEALAVVHIGTDREENLVYTLKRVKDVWRIDLPGYIPGPDALEGDRESAVEVLDSANRHGRALAAGDGKTACSLLTAEAAAEQGRSYRPSPKSKTQRPPGKDPCTFAVDTGLFAPESAPQFDKALAVGDIALAYAKEDMTFLVDTPEGWRIDNLPLGIP